MPEVGDSTMVVNMKLGHAVAKLCVACLNLLYNLLLHISLAGSCADGFVARFTRLFGGRVRCIISVSLLVQTEAPSPAECLRMPSLVISMHQAKRDCAIPTPAIALPLALSDDDVKVRCKKGGLMKPAAVF